MEKELFVAEELRQGKSEFYEGNARVIIGLRYFNNYYDSTIRKLSLIVTVHPENIFGKKLLGKKKRHFYTLSRS